MIEGQVPEGFNHKATSEGFNGHGKVEIFYSNTEDLYLIIIDDRSIAFITKPQLELFHHAASDVIDMNKR